VRGREAPGPFGESRISIAGHGEIRSHRCGSGSPPPERTLRRRRCPRREQGGHRGRRGRPRPRHRPPRPRPPGVPPGVPPGIGILSERQPGDVLFTGCLGAPRSASWRRRAGARLNGSLTSVRMAPLTRRYGSGHKGWRGLTMIVYASTDLAEPGAVIAGLRYRPPRTRWPTLRFPGWGRRRGRGRAR
jgi:hypothetical protein